MATGHRILALIFELRTANDRVWLLIAWLTESGNGKYLVPAHPDKTLLNVQAGDVLIFKRSEHLVICRLKPWRTTECRDETAYSEIVCGDDWEANTRR